MIYPKYKYVIAGIDIVLILLSYVVAIQLRFSDTSNIFKLSGYEFIFALIIVLFLGVAYLFIFQSLNLYKINILLDFFPQIFLIIKGLAIGLVLVIIVQFTIKFSFVFESRLLFLYYAISAAGSLIVVRTLIFRPIFIYFANKGLYSRNVAIIGTKKNAKMIAAGLLTKANYGMSIKGFIGDSGEVGEKIFQKLSLIGKMNDLESAVKKYKIDELIIAPDDINYGELISLIERCQRTEIAIQVVSDLYRIIPDKLVVEKYSDIPLVRMHGSSHTRLWTKFRRIFDILISVAIIILILPLLMAIMIAIKLTSRGPLIYKQRRIGKDGKEFTFYKFRTMFVGSDKDESRTEVMKNFIKGNTGDKGGSKKFVDESKFTIVGKLLRRTSFDELPQFFNVLGGDMAVVGPRPCLPYEYEQYDEWRKKRNEVLPGITGLWQVSGRSEVAHNEMIVMDLYYIRNSSPWFDLLLIFKTIMTMINGRGGG